MFHYTFKILLSMIILRLQEKIATPPYPVQSVELVVYEQLLR